MSVTETSPGRILGKISEPPYIGTYGRDGGRS